MKKSSISYNDHILVPKHEKISDKQKSELLDKYKCDITSIPEIKSDDPALLGLGTKPGDIIKILRSSRTEGVSTFYRRVTNE